MPQSKPTPKRKKNKGFALIAALSLMMLIVLLAVGLVGLSSIALRTTSQASAMADAQANARLALMIAIGELQKHAGPDMRVTAPADILDESMAPLTGVWRSWEGTNHELSGDFRGRPIAPDYNKESRLISWLVSGATPELTVNELSSLIAKTPRPYSVALVSSGSIAEGDERQVHVTLQPLENGGRYAWWVSPENQKAHFPKPHEPENNTVADWSTFIGTHSVSDPAGFGLDALLADASPAAKTFSLATGDLYADANGGGGPGRSFHDLSTSSTGLLTNVATGGWRKDLSLLTERWNEQPESGLELFQLLPDQSLEFNRPTRENNSPVYPHTVDNSLPYHWAHYLELGPAYHRNGPVNSWTNLAYWATHYKKLSPTAGTPSYAMPNYDPQTNTFRRVHELPLFHQLARLQFIASYYAIPGVEDPNKMIPCLLLTPVVTFWNPYNIELVENRTPKLYRMDMSTPLALQYRIGGTTYPMYAVQESRDYALTNRITRQWSLEFRFHAPMTLKPGETRVFSPPENERFRLPDSRTPNQSGARRVDMVPGYRSGGGYLVHLNQILDFVNTGPHDPEKVELAPATSIRVIQAKFDNRSHNNVGVYFQEFLNGNAGSGRSFNWFESTYPRDQADILYPPLTEFPEVTLAECFENPVPFLSMIAGPRNASHTHLASKGMVQGNPLVTSVQPGQHLQQRHCIKYNFRGGRSLINSPWDYSYVEHSSGPGDTALPEVDNVRNSGYIISGFQKADGLDRCVLAYLPTRPISSLGDLTHWDARRDNPLPPFGYNLIGNSDATPLVAADKVQVPFEPARAAGGNRYNPRRNLQNDDSYILNHVFFDDWFVSSIAPQPVNFGSGGGTFKDTYKAFVQGDTRLANRAYRVVQQDLADTAAGAEARYQEHVQPVNSWRTIASRLEVEGMFNVNSTSVRAWRALLGHARDQRIPYLDQNGISRLSDPHDHALPRAGVAGDVQAGIVRPATYSFATEFSGYRVLDDEMLDFLAEEVVKQVRLRGPFLSLSEFVNRRLTANPSQRELALSGAIQAALNALADNSSLNPMGDLQGESRPSTGNPVGEHDYEFPQAAVGHSSYGVPGWIRQADILRPLAPVLSARDDTFTIRAYGDSRDANGNVVARAWCEAVVQRTKDFVNRSESADLTGMPSIPENQSFGRRFEMISFRWLNANEI